MPKPVVEAVVIKIVQTVHSPKPAAREAGGFLTPSKRLVKMHRQERSGGGYSTENFGAFSYKETLVSPSKKIVLAQGLFGLLETKIKNKAFNKAVNSFNNGWSITTNNSYHSGGRIWILWKPGMFRVHILEYNAQYIHMKVEALVSRSVFFLTMVYAFNGISERAPLWDHLRMIAQQVAGPWAIAGDFNCVLAANERFGGATSLAKMEPFRKCVAECEVIDIAAVGSVFTWNNKQQPEERIYSRLDRFLVNKAWCDSFPDMYAHFLPEGMMDHTPCIVKSNKVVQGNRSFKYFNMWGKSKEFLPLVNEMWDYNIDGTPLFKLAKNLKNLKPGLKRLNMEGFSDIEKATGILEKQVEEMQVQLGVDPSDVSLINQECEASKKLKELQCARDSFLYQKAKGEWIKDGDANTSYFHSIIKKRRNRNKFFVIEDMNGKTYDTSDQVQSAFLEFYEQLFGDKSGY
ncbi:uncharacterized protein LOC141588225 [Silene latifolia]|uniref:uncharacterized protein LOC141588225 n=1 Tax=Silene latifolia TaxID=37657 RepID=UPI003D781629